MIYEAMFRTPTNGTFFYIQILLFLLITLCVFGFLWMATLFTKVVILKSRQALLRLAVGPSYRQAAAAASSSSTTTTQQPHKIRKVV